MGGAIKLTNRSDGKGALLKITLPNGRKR